MNKTVHELIESKRKESILKSMSVSKQKLENEFTNTRIDIEPYDKTFLNVARTKGSDYVVDQLLKQLNGKHLVRAIENYLNQSINNIRVGYYTDQEFFEIALVQKDGRFMWQHEAYGW